MTRTFSIPTVPMIIMRSGGLDGVAIQGNEYRYLLNKLDINVDMITGKNETEFGPVDQIGERQVVVPRINLYHRESQKLFGNIFTRGPEKEGIGEITDKEWLEIYHTHKAAIKHGIERVLKAIHSTAPVFVFNLLSLRHMHPAAAVAIRELIEENPERAFISHAADPDAERPEKIARVKKKFLPIISSANPEEPYSGGCYHYENLYHIVLNPTQRSNFINKYKIPEDHVFEIPDFLEFKSKKPKIKKNVKDIFLAYLTEHHLATTKNSYKYNNKAEISRDTLFFLSPVRPVYRKRLKESMLVAQQYAKAKNLPMAFVVTHPNLDDKPYFLETVKFAEELGVPYFHLGRKFSLEALDNVYENFAALKTVGVVASSAGGWENALNEMARYCIPFYMNSNLNSYVPITETIRIKTHGTDFSVFSEYIENASPEKLKDMNLTKLPEMRRAFQWIDKVLCPETREDIIFHNYRKSYNYLSHKATLPRLKKMLKFIGKRHGKFLPKKKKH